MQLMASESQYTDVLAREIMTRPEADQHGVISATCDRFAKQPISFFLPSGTSRDVASGPRRHRRRVFRLKFPRGVHFGATPAPLSVGEG